ncbi:MAG: efflux RND transporter periplasmic adaptor subunit, partial [Gallionellaceae bacterium]|nr:efflux RND transporter periplasmic adaptor subunit [Gallionellaceae bacterium]
KVQGNSKEGRGKERGATDPGRTGAVYVLENGQVKPVRIAAGITDNRFTEVLGGDLKEGGAVIIEDKQPPAKSSTSPPGMRMF